MRENMIAKRLIMDVGMSLLNWKAENTFATSHICNKSGGEPAHAVINNYGKFYLKA